MAVQVSRCRLALCLLPAAVSFLFHGCAYDPYAERIGHGGTSFFSVAFSPDSSRLAAGSTYSNTVYLFDAATGKVDRIFPGDDKGRISSWSKHADALAFSPDGCFLASVGIDNALIVWNVGTGQRQSGFAGVDLPSSIAFSPEGRILACGAFDGTVTLFDVATGDRLQSLEGCAGKVQSVAFSPAGDLLAAASKGEIRLWALPSGQSLPPIVQPKVSPSFVTFSPNGELLAASSPSTVALWKLSTPGARIEMKDKGLSAGETVLVVTMLIIAIGASHGNIGTHSSPANNYEPLAFAPDGRTLAVVRPGPGLKSSFGGYEMKTLNAGNLNPLSIFRLNADIYGLAWSSDLRRLAVAGAGVELYDTSTGRRVCFPAK